MLSSCVPLTGRNGWSKEHAGPEDPDNNQCPHRVSKLCNPISNCRFAAADGKQVFESGFQSDTDKGKGKEPDAVALAEVLHSLYHFLVVRREDDEGDEKRGHHKADDKFRKPEPHLHKRGLFSAFLNGKAYRCPDGQEKSGKTYEQILRHFHHGRGIEGFFRSDDFTCGHHGTRVVDDATDPCARHIAGEIHPFGNGRHDDDEHDGADHEPGNDITHFLGVALDGSAGGYGGGNTADGVTAGYDAGKTFRQTESPADPVGHEPHRPDNEKGLGHANGTGLNDNGEQDVEPHDYQTDLDEILRHNSRLQPVGYAQDIADYQAEEQCPEDILETPRVNGTLLTDYNGQETEDIDNDKTRDVLTDISFHESGPDDSENTEEQKEHNGRHEGFNAFGKGLCHGRPFPDLGCARE